MRKIEITQALTPVTEFKSWTETRADLNARRPHPNRYVEWVKSKIANWCFKFLRLEEVIFEKKLSEQVVEYKTYHIDVDNVIDQFVRLAYEYRRLYGDRPTHLFVGMELKYPVMHKMGDLIRYAGLSTDGNAFYQVAGVQIVFTPYLKGAFVWCDKGSRE